MSVERAFRQRALGAVVGSAVGDALGAPFEFGPAGAYRRRFPEPILGGTGEMTGGGVWRPGEFTDDTQMAVIQARSLLERAGIDGADLFDRFRAWTTEAKDVGISTRSVLNSGLPWDEAADARYRRHPNSSAGNGALMRATPAAVHYATDDLATTIAAALELAAITHGDPAAQWGTALYHAMIHAALHGDDPFEALAAALDSLAADQYRFAQMLHADWQPSGSDLGNGTVWTCLAQAVWALRTTETFEDAVVAAIELGDDADTVAAVAGGLAGAVHGIQAIPSRWTTYLHGTVPGEDGQVRAHNLQQLTFELLGASSAPVQSPGTPLGLVEIAPGVLAANLAAARTVDPDHAVISLCRVGDTFVHHPIRRELYLVDQEGDHNLSLGIAVTDAVDALQAFRKEGRTVLVHCQDGESRTGLVLRAWLMSAHRWDEPTATAHLSERWPHLALWNETFTHFLRTEWARGGPPR